MILNLKLNNTEKIILEKMINNPGKTFSREAYWQTNRS